MVTVRLEYSQLRKAELGLGLGWGCLLLKPVMSLIRQQGVRSIVFLDNMLLMAGSKERLLKQVQEIVQLILQLLGFVINFENPKKENSVSGV